MKHAAEIRPEEFTTRDVARILDHVWVGAGSGCWEWGGGTNDRGYGYVWHDGRMRRAHRIVYVIVTGRRIPAELVLDHTCGVIVCVRPAHLEPVSQGVNVLRGMLDRGDLPAWLTPEERHYLSRMPDDELRRELEAAQADHLGVSA